MRKPKRVPGYYTIAQIAEMKGTSRQAVDIWSRKTAAEHFSARDGVRCIKRDTYRRLAMAEFVSAKLAEVEAKLHALDDLVREMDRRMDDIVRRVAKQEAA